MLESLYRTLSTKSHSPFLTARFSRKASVPTRGEIQRLHGCSQAYAQGFPWFSDSVEIHKCYAKTMAIWACDSNLLGTRGAWHNILSATVKILSTFLQSKKTFSHLNDQWYIIILVSFHNIWRGIKMIICVIQGRWFCLKYSK